MSLGAIDFGLIVDSSVIMVENCIRKLSHDNGDARARRHHSRCGGRGSQANDVRRTDHCGRVPADPVARRHRRKAVSSDGSHRAVCSGRLDDFVAVIHARDGVDLLAQEDERRGRFPHPDRQMVLRANRDTSDQASVRHHRNGADAVRDQLADGARIWVPSSCRDWKKATCWSKRLRLPSATLEGSIEMSTQIEDILKKYPEVKTVFSKTGRPEIANDVMGVHQTDVWVLLNPIHDWPDTKDSG